uniref:Uncharacterized protein n=1 Tax=Pavo cristatus TaxID=9049 RepID=A0A8C9F333_PAVCR
VLSPPSSQGSTAHLQPPGCAPHPHFHARFGSRLHEGLGAALTPPAPQPSAEQHTGRGLSTQPGIAAASGRVCWGLPCCQDVGGNACPLCRTGFAQSAGSKSRAPGEVP